MNMKARMKIVAAMAIALVLLSAPGRAATSYPMQGGNLMRHATSLAPSSITAPLVQGWTAQACLGESWSHPVIFDDKITQSFSGGVMAWDRATGTVLWRWASSYGPIFNAPTYDAARDRIYVNTSRGALVCLNAANGVVLWHRYQGYQRSVEIWASPTYWNDKIYYWNGRQSFVCVDADNPTGPALWSHDFGSLTGGRTAALDAGLIWVASQNGDLMCFNANTGSITWQLGVKLTRTYNSACLVTADKLYVQTSTGRVDCHNRTTGQFLWSFQTLSWSNSNLSYDGTNIYCTSDDRCLRALHPDTGVQKWVRCFSGNFASSGPFVAGGAVYAAGCTGEYYACDLNGNRVWTFNHGRFNDFADFAEVDGHLFASTKDKLRCFIPGGTYTPTPSFSASPTANGTFTQSPTITITTTPTFTATVTPTQTVTFTATPTYTHSTTATPTVTDISSLTHTPTFTATFTSSVTITPTPTFTMSPTAIVPVNTSTVTPTMLPTEYMFDIDDDDHSYVAPNPVTGNKCSVVYKMQQPGRARVRVFNAAGEAVAEVDEYHARKGLQRTDLDVTDFAPGVYFYKCKIDYDSGREHRLRLRKFLRVKK